MPAQTSLAVKRELVPSALIAPERRLHKRFTLKLVGRFMRADRLEYPCELIDISVGGMAVATPVQPHLGEGIIVYMDELGGLEGKAARIFDGGFAIGLCATPHRREKLVARLTWLINRDELAEVDARAHQRRLPTRNDTKLKLSDEIALRVQVIDVSLSGANIATEARPPLGSKVQLGKLPAQVVRHHERGIGIRFIGNQIPEAVKGNFD
ncbi:MAG TPA: PilZ domain-containing protein [Hyphomicrobiaceae bacterium]|nr:PilZ domain-containing protein [Hyphomicrobiaceae bacterium]